MSASWPPDLDQLDVIEEWMRAQRWFPADSVATLEVVANIDLSVDSAPPHWDGHTPLDPVWICLVRVGGAALVQVPLVLTDVAPDNGRGVIARVEDAWLVDGPQHPAFLRAWVRRAGAEGSIGAGVIDEDGAEEGKVDPSAQTIEDGLLEQADRAHLMTGEQSNSSVVFNGPEPRAVAKFFRVVTPGIHPDLEIPRALVRQGWRHVPAPMAFLEIDLPERPGEDSPTGEPALSGIAAQLVEGARDGFELFVEMAARGEDPSKPARDLGRVTAEMHEHLARAFGENAPPDASELAHRIRVNVQATAAEVHDLTPELVAGLESSVAAVEAVDALPVTIRIHGDYHLGQTLVGDAGWFVLDFEGEPLRSLAERRRPDLALRDVAGMLRSFDYASAQASRRAPALSPSTTAEIPQVGSSSEPSVSPDPQWSIKARAAFIEGYTDGHGFSQADDALVRALMIEKAAYEAVYEHRLRPSWLPIPLAALEDLSTSST